MDDAHVGDLAVFEAQSQAIFGVELAVLGSIMLD